MARWLLDTCVVSELSRKDPDDAVCSWLKAEGVNCRLSVVSLGEFYFGVESLEPSARRNHLARWVDEIVSQYSGRMVETDRAVWAAFGRMKASLRSMGRPQEDIDLLIAATAATNGLTLATRNIRHFADTGVRLFNPWTGKHA